MSITVCQDHLFKHGYPIKYLVGYDNIFAREKFNGCLNFYHGDPQFVVCVEIICDNKNSLKDDDILVIIGDCHNPKVIDYIVKTNNDIIFEICKTTNHKSFCLDLTEMRVVEPEDFNLFLPVRGLNTLFMFENIPEQYYCVVNPAKSIKDSDFYAWLLSYIYSTVVCLTPNTKIEDYSKQFLQAISSLSASKGNQNAIYIAESKSVLACHLSDLNEKLIPVPGNNTKRLELLVEKSMKQITKSKQKSERKKRNKRK